MITTDYFKQPQNNVLIDTNLKIVLHLWKEGQFQSNLQKKLNLDSTKSIELMTEVLNKLGFLEIDQNKMNVETSKTEPFYFISDENLRAIFIHICEFSGVSYNQNVLEKIKEDRNAFSQELINDIQNEFTQNNELKDRILKALMRKKISFFFLFIIEQGQTFRNDEKCCEFSNNIMIEMLLTNVQQGKNDFIVKDEQTTEIQAKGQLKEKSDDEVKKYLEDEKQIFRPWAHRA